MNVVYCMCMAPKRVIFGVEMRMQTWKWTELLQMLEVTTTGSHAGSQALKQHLHFHLVGCSNLSRIKYNVKLENNFEKKELFGLCN